MKKTIEELSSALAQLTAQYTDSYLRKHKDGIDKQLWAALSIGFIGALKEHDYSDKEVNQMLDLTKKKISQYEKS